MAMCLIRRDYFPLLTLITAPVLIDPPSYFAAENPLIGCRNKAITINNNVVSKFYSIHSPAFG